MSQKSGPVRRIGPHRFTEKQGHYLAFICVYKRMFGQAPAEADVQRHFRVSPPSVHQMVRGLERDGLIRRRTGIPRSIDLLVPPQDLPILDWLNSSNSL
jgi:DNA-binding MarR family transcriptional regulator